MLENEEQLNFREFDLNIEKILENWEVYHAIREIIANALDEQILTKTKDIEIFKKDNTWHIVDFGRGLNYHHLTQNENKEKLENNKLIGRFGVGLKDALATLYRHGIKVKILSKYGSITLIESSKIGFSDIITLHAKISSINNNNFIGTEFLLEGCSDEDVEKAKKLFLNFSNEKVIEKNNYGQVIEKANDIANIYINGVKVAEEPNFLFSYNITSLTKQLKKSLNRERINVGRTAYADRIKSIITASTSKNVIEYFIKDFQQSNGQEKHDELTWNDVALYISEKMNEFHKNVTFITKEELFERPSVIDEMKTRGFNPVVVSESLSNKMENQNIKSNEGNLFNTTNKFLENMKNDLNIKFIDIKDLSPLELNVYQKMNDILQFIGGKPSKVKEIKISESIYESEFLIETVGLWQPGEQRIIIKRKQLKSFSSFAGTLLHECAHAISGEDDVSRSFERELTNIIGKVVEKAVKDK